MHPPLEVQEALYKEARAEFWRRGELADLYLDSNQIELYRQIHASSRRRFVLECARRIGKSFMLCVMALETCLRRPHSRVVYAAPTYKDAVEFILPIIESLAEDAPPESRPKFDTQTWHYKLPNGSHIAIFGCDTQEKADRGRGPAAHLVIIDEAGFNRVLGYVMRSVLKPQTLTTKAKILLASTPSAEAGHEFTSITEAAEAIGPQAYAHRTIYDNPRLTVEDVEEYIREDAEDEGLNVDEYKATDTFQREYLARRIVDKRLTVVPEWAEYGERLNLLREVERPRFFDAYVSLDMGGIDPHAVLFGYWHYALNALVIEDELLLREGENTAQLAEAIKAKEAALWGGKTWTGTLRGAYESGVSLPSWLAIQAAENPQEQPFLRYSDNDAQMIRDLVELHGVAFIPTDKSEKKWHVNKAQVMFREGRIIVSPKCRNLQRHLRTTLWLNEKRKDYRRINKEHGDLVDALVYMVRNVMQHRNPTPPQWNVNPDTQWVPGVEATEEEETLVGAFG